MKYFILLSIITSSLLISCNNSGSPKALPPISAPMSQEKQIKESTSELQLGDITLQVPQGWKKEKPSSQMRVAQLALSAHPEIKMAIFYFGEQDMIEQNISRWRGQFTKEDSFTELPADNSTTRAVKILGTYKKKPFPMAEEFKDVPDYGVLAAIVVSSTGPYYLKIEAPKSIIEQNQSSFLEMLKGKGTIASH